MIPPEGAAARLTTTWFGQSLSAHARERLAAIAQLHRVEPGAVLIREGAETERMGILLDGLLSLRVAVAGRGRATLMTIEPGDVFGWSAVVALQPSEVIVFEAERLRALLGEDDALAATVYPRLLQCVSRRLVATRTQLLDLYARDREYEPW
jgi:CRP-like cAMP-binding protein